MLSTQVDTALRRAVARGGSEPEIVRRFATAVTGIAPPPNTTVRAGFIHQRPYAFFVTPSAIVGKSKCELGDVLYVSKHVDTNGSLISARTAFLQAKLGSGSWFIEPHQLEFLANIRRIQFRFGNSVFKRTGYKPCIYPGLRHTGDLGFYLLLGSADPLCYSTKRVATKQRLFQHGFSLGPSTPVRCKEANTDFCVNHDSHRVFLEQLLQGAAGAKLSGQLRNVVGLIYKRIGWVLDPPEEFADNFIEDDRGMAIVEFTSVQERAPEERRAEG